MVGREIALGDRKAPFSSAHLNSVIGNAQSHGETEGLAEPFCCATGIRVAENWNHWAGRNRAVTAHKYHTKDARRRLARLGSRKAAGYHTMNPAKHLSGLKFACGRWIPPVATIESKPVRACAGYSDNLGLSDGLR
jgi:hypothetical protein